MRHLKKKLKFGRPKKEARRLLRNLVANLILYEKVKTTEAKAKKAKKYLDKLINIGKKKDLNSIRYLERFFYRKEPIRKIIEDLAEKYKKRAGGYSRIIPLGRRKGDSAKIVLWELVEFDKEEPKKVKAKDKDMRNRSEKEIKTKVITKIKTK